MSLLSATSAHSRRLRRSAGAASFDVLFLRSFGAAEGRAFASSSSSPTTAHTKKDTFLGSTRQIRTRPPVEGRVTAAQRQQPQQQRHASFAATATAARGEKQQQGFKPKFFEFLGASILAAITSAFLSFFTHGNHHHQVTRAEERYATPLTEGADDEADAAAPPSSDVMLASSAAFYQGPGLFMDPRVGIIYQNDTEGPNGHGGSGKDRGGGGGREKDKDTEDCSPAEENSTVVSSLIAPSESEVNHPYELSVRAIKGVRASMEDTYYVAPGGRFAAVFDGHGGPLVSVFLRESLYGLAKQALRRKHWEYDHQDISSLNNNDTSTASISSHVAALRSAFKQAEEFVMNQPDWSRQGSTAVAVWVHESPENKARTVVSANVGDSRAIMSRQGKAVDLTRDHKPNEEREKDRIKRLGGNIEWDALAKVHRVESLSLSRAIGDAFAKPIVSSEVDIKLFPVVEGKDEYLLLATDGLWDVFTSQEAVSYVKERFDEELSRTELSSQEDVENCKVVLRRNMARSLCKEAIRRGSGDNVSVLIVWLNDDIPTMAPSPPGELLENKKEE